MTDFRIAVWELTLDIETVCMIFKLINGGNCEKVLFEDPQAQSVNTNGDMIGETRIQTVNADLFKDNNKIGMVYGNQYPMLCYHGSLGIYFSGSHFQPCEVKEDSNSSITTIASVTLIKTQQQFNIDSYSCSFLALYYILTCVDNKYQKSDDVDYCKKKLFDFLRQYHFTPPSIKGFPWTSEYSNCLNDVNVPKDIPNSSPALQYRFAIETDPHFLSNYLYLEECFDKLQNNFYDSNKIWALCYDNGGLYGYPLSSFKLMLFNPLVSTSVLSSTAIYRGDGRTNLDSAEESMFPNAKKPDINSYTLAPNSPLEIQVKEAANLQSVTKITIPAITDTKNKKACMSLDLERSEGVFVFGDELKDIRAKYKVRGNSRNFNIFSLINPGVIDLSGKQILSLLRKN